jgi:hypothetical protein
MYPPDGIPSEAYGNPITITSTDPPVSSLPANNPVIHCGEPQLLKVQEITASSAKLLWGAALCAQEYMVIWKPTSDSGFGDTLFTNATQFTLTGLVPEKKYSVWVRSHCSSGNIFSRPADKKFTTEALRIADGAGVHISALVYPNPVSSMLFIRQHELSEGIISITDLAGRIIHSQPATDITTQINVAGYSPGTYVVKVISDRDVYATTVTKE